MKNYREQVGICCARCRHSFDVEWYDGCLLVCVEDLPISAETLYKVYSHKDEDQIYHEELDNWRDILYNDTSRHVSLSGLCDNYENRGN